MNKSTFKTAAEVEAFLAEPRQERVDGLPPEEKATRLKEQHRRAKLRYYLRKKLKESNNG